MSSNRTSWQLVVRDYFLITVGALLTALALDLFLVPGKIAAGGVSGLATVFYHLFGFHVGVTMLVINVPLFIAGWRMIGRTFVVRTFYGAVMLSVLTDALAFLPALTSDSLLAALWGGILSGIGIGMTLKWGGSTGGTDLAALLLQRFFRISVGQTLLVIDFAIITFAGIVFGAELALYALITLFITTRVIDLVQEGMVYAKAAYIISDHAEEISQAVLDKMARGVTSFKATGMWTKTEREVLFIIVARSEIATLKQIVSRIDPRAFMVIHDAHEVLGEGFKGLQNPY
ncbi:MAG: YitT family protein [Firmicutes bacterium]|nr:YitT family protein [Bacillota bacterium]